MMEHDQKQRLIPVLWQTLQTKYRKRANANLQKIINRIPLYSSAISLIVFLLIQALGVDKV